MMWSPKSFVPLLCLSFACGEEPELEAETIDPIRNGVEIGTTFRTVGIIYNRARGTTCSGTLLRSSIVLTAAHCVEGAFPSDIWFAYHLPVVVIDPFNAPEIWNVVSDYYIHPTWDSFAGVGADLAVLKLEQRYTGFSTYPSLDSAGTPIGTTVEIVGWGQDETNGNANIRRRGTMTIVDKEDLPIDNFGQLQPNGTLVLQPNASDQHTCRGDSGGPAFRTTNGVRYIAGVASAIRVTDPSMSCTTAFEAYHVTVSQFRPWIAAARDSLDPPGRCVGSDNENFATLYGGCFARAVGVSFSQRSEDPLTKSQAHSYCTNLIEGGYADWRLPAQGELELAADEGAGSSLIKVGAARYWSANNTAVRLTDGAVTSPALSTGLYVYCVR